jgi:hypothetical protein
MPPLNEFPIAFWIGDSPRIITGYDERYDHLEIRDPLRRYELTLMVPEQLLKFLQWKENYHKATKMMETDLNRQPKNLTEALELIFELRNEIQVLRAIGIAMRRGNRTEATAIASPTSHRENAMTDHEKITIWAQMDNISYTEAVNRFAESQPVPPRKMHNFSEASMSDDSQIRAIMRDRNLSYVEAFGIWKQEQSYA